MLESIPGAIENSQYLTPQAFPMATTSIRSSLVSCSKNKPAGLRSDKFAEIQAPVKHFSS